MSSVVVGWTGRCPDRRDRARLIAHLERLAEASDSYLRTRLPEPVIAIGRAGALLEQAAAAPAPISITSTGPLSLSDRDLERDRARSEYFSRRRSPRLSCR